MTLAATLARLSVEAGATSFIHLSALAADPHGLSAWARTKAVGEAAVRAACPGATIVRPADVVGPQDRFLNKFAQMQAVFPRMPLPGGGEARVQPLYVKDLAQALFRIALSENPDVMLAQTYDLAGPDEYTVRQVVEYVFEAVRSSSPAVVAVKPWQAALLGKAIDLLPNPLIGADHFLRLQVRPAPPLPPRPNAHTRSNARATP